MKISAINNYHSPNKSKLNFGLTTLVITPDTFQLMEKTGKGKLFKGAADIFERRLHDIPYCDTVTLSPIPEPDSDKWYATRMNEFSTLGKEDLMMGLDDYFYCGFYVNPKRSVAEVARDLFDAYSVLEDR